MDVKSEASKIKLQEKSLVDAELCGLLSTCGSISINRNGLVVNFHTENAPVARRIFTHLKKFYSEDVNAFARKNAKLKKNVYSVGLNDEAASKRMLSYCYGGDENVFENAVNPPLKSFKEYSSFVRGSFLGTGSVTDPKRSYHFEIVFENEKNAEFLKKILMFYEISSGVIIRKDKFILYIKEAEKISDILTIIGANSSVLSFENIRAIKETRNNVNRMVNCETANLEKIVNSSVEQVNDIEYIDRELGLKSLPDSLYELAIARLNNRNASLKDLGELLNPKVGKSGVNHRMKKIRKIAYDLRSGEYGE